jgi:uncharacterized SAM-binding protein YcdF (DUF218 family)
MPNRLKDNRAVRIIAILLSAILVAGFGHVPILREIASFLIVEDPLQPADAIIALGGQTPFREIEAARLYHAGLAPQIVIVREAPNAQSEALQHLGVKKVQEWELARAVLTQQGVPASAILIPKDEGVGTLEELQAAYAAVRREALGVRRTPNEMKANDESASSGSAPQAASSPSSISRNVALASEPSSLPASQQPAGNATNVNNPINASDALRVILVTSKYHTRRTRLIWQYVTAGRSQAIVRTASGDPFDPDRWWEQRSFALSVVREYLGLVNYYAGFPVTP